MQAPVRGLRQDEFPTLGGGQQAEGYSGPPPYDREFAYDEDERRYLHPPGWF